MQTKLNVTTKLEKEYIQYLELHLKRNNWSRVDLLKEALKQFKLQLSKNNVYKLKFNQFVRVELKDYSIIIRNKLGFSLTKLATELSISRVQLLREVFLTYLMQIKTEENELS